MAVNVGLVIKLSNAYFGYSNQEMCTIVLNYAQCSSNRCTRRSRSTTSVRQQCSHCRSGPSLRDSPESYL